MGSTSGLPLQSNETIRQRGFTRKPKLLKNCPWFPPLSGVVGMGKGPKEKLRITRPDGGLFREIVSSVALRRRGSRGARKRTRKRGGTGRRKKRSRISNLGEKDFLLRDRTHRIDDTQLRNHDGKTELQRDTRKDEAADSQKPESRR